MSAAKKTESGQTTQALKDEIARLKAENEAIKKKNQRSLTLKVSQKGGVSLYGLGRFPVTLYKEQWARVLAMSSDIETFLKDNDKLLKNKSDAPREEPAKA